MSDWAAKVLAGVPRYVLNMLAINMDKNPHGAWVKLPDVEAALARMGAGDGLVERLLRVSIDMGDIPSTTTLPSEVIREAAARIAALTAQNREMALDVLASSGQAQEAYDAQIAAEAEAAALRAKVADAEREAESRSAMFATACEERNAAEAEAAALRERVALLEGALADMPKAVLRTTICQGPAWPDDRPGVWLAALEACAKSVQAAVDAALTDGGSNE